MTFKVQFLCKDGKWKTHRSYASIRIARRYLAHWDNKYPSCTWRATTSRPRKYWLQRDFRTKTILIRTRKTLSII